MLPHSDHLSSGSLQEQLRSEDANLDTQVIRLMITTHVPQPEEGLHGSSFVECMDYSMTSFQLDPRVKEAHSQTASASAAPTSPTTPPAPAMHPFSRGFGNFVRKLSLIRAPPKRELPLTSPSGLLRLQSVSQNSSVGSAVALRRKKSDKRPRPVSAVVIQPGKAESWCPSFGKKAFTPSSTTSPISPSLSCSTSGSSTRSTLLKPRQAGPDAISGVGSGRPAARRSNSITQIHISSPVPVRSINKGSTTDPSGPSFEVLSRSSSTRRKISLSRRDPLSTKHLTPVSLSIFSRSIPSPRDTGSNIDQS
ncbi:hypothetical protein VP01_2609g1 [Puccinia sorghi]|uniref:Uncharacterized protein n=1 Tax=Puccinia sorghi TaxID=27349 RepID=A0A0L6V4L3_9BASI|nr:hypothetical protein VP01_2609g1 [Puccinia sorghi]